MGVRVRQKVKGKGNPWWVFISHNGKRASRKVGDKKAAKTVASEIRAKIQLGEFGFEEQKPVPTFLEYADSWIKNTVPATCKQSTLRDYQDMLRIHVLPVFGDLKITDITRGKVKSFLKTKDVKADINPLTSEELKVLLGAVSEHFPEHFTLFLLLARTGMRIGEALALQWDDVDFDKRFIEVKRSYVRGRISTPKNSKTRRVDMSLQLAEALKAQKQWFMLKLVGSQNDAQYVFTNKEGGLIDISNWRNRVFNKALTKAEVKKIRIHDLRHTYATLRISKGDNIAYVSKQLGHHSVKFTWDVYYHWVPGMKKSEVDELDDPSLKHPSAPPLHPDHQKIEKGLTAIG